MDDRKKFIVRSLFFIVPILMTACADNNNEPLKAWTFSSARINTIRCCGLGDEEDASGCNRYSPIFSALLGLDKSNAEITLAMNDQTFTIFHDGRQVVSGALHKTPTGFKLFSQNAVVLVRSAVESGDSLVLNLDGENQFVQVEMVFKRKTTD